jgi:queuine tRNA-ribosyltransferase
VYPDLRRRAAEFAVSFNCDGYAIGGLSVGEPAEEMYRMIEVVNSILPKMPRANLMAWEPQRIYWRQ